MENKEAQPEKILIENRSKTDSKNVLYRFDSVDGAQGLEADEKLKSTEKNVTTLVVLSGVLFACFVIATAMLSYFMHQSRIDSKASMKSSTMEKATNVKAAIMEYEQKMGFRLGSLEGSVSLQAMNELNHLKRN